MSQLERGASRGALGLALSAIPIWRFRDRQASDDPVSLSLFGPQVFRTLPEYLHSRNELERCVEGDSVMLKAVGSHRGFEVKLDVILSSGHAWTQRRTIAFRREQGHGEMEIMSSTARHVHQSVFSS